MRFLFFSLFHSILPPHFQTSSSTGQTRSFLRCISFPPLFSDFDRPVLAEEEEEEETLIVVTHEEKAIE